MDHGDENLGNVEGPGPEAQQGALPPTAPRVRHTHSSDVIIQLLKSLPLISALQKNKEIEIANAARSLKTLNHTIDPVAHPEPGSETASLISLDPEDRERFRVPSFASSFREHIYPSLARWIADKETDTAPKRKAVEEKLSSEEARALKRRCMQGSALAPFQSGVPWTTTFAQSLFDTEDAQPVPLPFFRTQNLRRLINEAAKIPMVKSNPKPGETKGISILDVETLTSKDWFGKELSLSFSQWSEAAANMYAFQMQRDADGPYGTHADWYNNHFNFYNTQEKKDELYEVWKTDELKFRQEHWSVYGEFVAERYESTYNISEKQSELKQDIKQDMRKELIAEVREMLPSLLSKASFSRDMGNKTSAPAGRQPPRPHFPSNDRAPPAPFQAGSGRASSFPTDCIICAQRGHDYRIHHDATSVKFKDNKPVSAKFVNRTLVDSNNQVLCINWNTRADRGAPCQHTKDERAHHCSFCGSSAHHALSWTCQPRPN